MENINKNQAYPVALSIAGSDSGGCAGIQADIKSISASGAFACTAITAITAQNTLGVEHVHPIPVESIEKQIQAVLSDLEVKAVKIGMLHSAEVIEAVEQKLAEFQVSHIVLDPVMVATSGDPLLQVEAIERLKKFLPKARLITPNLPEAEILLGKEIRTQEDIYQCAPALAEKFNTSVLLKAGHLENEKEQLTDILYLFEEKRSIELQAEIISTKNTHGTGCSLSSSIAAFLAQGYSLEEAVKHGKNFLHQALKAGKNKVLGKGHGPVHHFYTLY